MRDWVRRHIAPILAVAVLALVSLQAARMSMLSSDLRIELSACQDILQAVQYEELVKEEVDKSAEIIEQIKAGQRVIDMSDFEVFWQDGKAMYRITGER